MFEQLTGNERQHKRHHREHRLQVSTFYTPDDGGGDDADGSQDGDSGELVGPEAFDEFEAVGALVAAVKVGEPVNPEV